LNHVTVSSLTENHNAVREPMFPNWILAGRLLTNDGLSDAISSGELERLCSRGIHPQSK